MNRRYPVQLPGPTEGLTIGLMGGSFDPAHSGHAHVIETAKRALGLDWVWVLPSPGNPLKQTQTPFVQRLESARAALSTEGVVVSTLEADLGTRYSIDLVRYLTGRLPRACFVWIIGADSLAGFHRWRAWKEIASLMPVCVVSRPGATVRAGLSPFARLFADYRIPQTQARRLGNAPPPAWTILTAPYDPASSTLLRAKTARRARPTPR